MATLLGEKRSDLLRSAMIDLSILAGGGLLAYGGWLIYAPLSFIVPGVLLLGFGLVGARR
jgi:hypothetical protein